MMDNKSDVKALLARFQTAGVSLEGTCTPNPKPPVQPTLSGPMVPSKKFALEATLSGGAAASNITKPKPSYMKTTVSSNSASEPGDSLKPKAIASMFQNAKEDGKPPFGKPLKPKPPDSHQNGEPKFKAPLQKPLIADAKNTFPKPPPVTTKNFKSPKPENNESPAITIPTPPKMPLGPKPKSTFNMLRQHDDDKEEDNTTKPSIVQKSSFRAAQNLFNKPEETAKDEQKSQSSKESPAPAPVVPQKKPSYKGKPSGSDDAQTVKDDPSAPKKNPLPNIYALGSAPSKPNRPPKVNLEKLKRAGESPSEGPEIKKGGPPLPPPPPMSHPSSHAAPILPPRPPGPIVQQEEEYDDVGDLNDSSAGQRNEGSGSDGETYEELDGWSAPEVKEQEKKREKEEKKRAEQEKKEQKEREKKEQDARKKFKLSGPITVIHKLKAKVDCKGGKNEVSFKQGDSIDIIRITDNPEGRWLGRTQDGTYGYVKTESVHIDVDALKSQTRPLPENDGEVYDDVGSQEESIRGMTVPGVFLPPPPDGPDDIYDDLDDSSLNVSSGSRSIIKARSFIRMLKTPTDWRKSPVHINVLPPPPQFSPENNPGGEEIYDDVDTPPPPSSMPPSKPKPVKPDAKPDDPKKQKKFEKEEKDFRKKFKYDGEIQVLHQVTVINNKKGSGKDLGVQAGDTLDVISSADNDKYICRNKEGKFGYVLKSNVQNEGEDIYDDIGDDCIYDNDN